MFTLKTSLIIPTRNRVSFLSKTLKQIYDNKICFAEILIIDSSDKIYKSEINKIVDKYKIKLFETEPSTSKQRNVGIENASRDNKFIMFLDDDILFSGEMFSQMNQTIINNCNDRSIVGYGFNQIQDVKINLIEKIKSNKLINYLELYPDKPGKVALSGWQSKILNLKEDVIAEWIYTTACIYRLESIKNHRFDESFGSYSYLEDLDFSYYFYKSKKKILISSQAKYIHPLSIERSSFEFGIFEVKNRYKVVKKYKLSIIRFFIMSLLRTSIFLLTIFLMNKKKFFRALGNLYGILIVINKM